jgi:hypothetical protein
MKNENERLKLPPVPLFNARKISLDDYLKELKSYCIDVHNETKEFGFSITDSRAFFLFCMRQSSEPQYTLLRALIMKPSIKKGMGWDEEFNVSEVSEIFSDLELLKTHVKGLNQLTYKELNVKAIAEAYHMDGLSVKEIVDTMLKLQIIDEFNEHASPIDHARKIRRYVEQFKDWGLGTHSIEYNKECDK